MSNVLPLTEVRKNLSELVNQAYYEGRIFGIVKGKRPMGTLVGAREWKKIIRVIEKHDPGLADTLAIMADPKLQKLLKRGEDDVRKGKVISWEEVLADIE